MHQKEINAALGNVDIYLLDCILKGLFDDKKNLLDAGCGEGRNLRYFVNNQYDVTGIDTNPLAIKMAKMIYKNTKANFLEGDLAQLPFDDNGFDAVICMAVLHFAKSEQHFATMLGELARVLKGNGVLLIRMATNAGVNSSPENGFSYVLDINTMHEKFSKAGLALSSPWKSVVVEDKRSMGFLLLNKI